MSDIERIPSMRKEPKPRARRNEVTSPEPEAEALIPAPEVVAAPHVTASPARPASPPPAARAVAPAAAPSAATAPSPLPTTLRELLRRVEAAWLDFRAAANRFPGERMDEHLSDGGWTRKQMLSHIAAWHDLTADRLVKFMVGGQPVPLERDEDTFNAAVARQAIGKTAGEVLQDMERTFNRLRRQMQRLTDVQLRAADDWAAHIIAGNTYEHYAEHTSDLYLPEPEPTGGRR